MLAEQVHLLAPGDYLWVYTATYSNTIDVGLGRVIDHPTEGITTILCVTLSVGVKVEEKAIGEETKEMKFAPCTIWDAERWLTDNAIASHITKTVKDREKDLKIVIGFRNMFAALSNTPVESISGDRWEDNMEPNTKQTLDDEIPF